MGYTSIEQRCHDIATKVTYFVPLNEDLEIWWITITNGSEQPRKLDVFAYVELCLGHALVDLINQPNDQHFNIVHYDRKHQILYATKNYWVTYTGATVKQPNQEWNKYVFFASSLPIKGFDGKKDAFIGRWRSESNPIAVEEGFCHNTEITAGDACAAVQSEINFLPKERKEFVILLGIVDRENYSEQAQLIVDKYRKSVNVKNAFEELRKYWNSYLSVVEVNTPDPNMNLMLNIWAQRQSWVTFHMHRTAGYYHGGLLFGTGIRDQCQDLMGPVMAEPKLVADRICEVLRHQFMDGSTLHNYFPITGYGEKTGHADTPLWLPLAVITYLKETGDFSFLGKVVTYYDGGEGTVLEHITQAIDYVLRSLSPRNLPKFGPGDWNDTLDYVGRQGIGESIWVAELLCYILRETADLLEKLGAKEKPAEYRHQYQQIAKAINTICWDGEWYIRGTRDDGGVIGSHTNEEGKIFLESTTWAVISGIAPEERARLTMNSVYKMLNTPRGPKILTPAYTKVDQGIGLATRCVPGKKENGAIFNHPAAWAIMAECLLGNGDRAYEYYRKTLPINQAYDPDVYRMEPYVYSEYVTSPDHPSFGEASHSWLTGSAAWMLRVGLDYILGIRPTYEGLIIDPCIPSEWSEFRIKRKFRGALYNIYIENPNHVQHGVQEITVDGKPIEGQLIPAFKNGVHEVRCKMG
jgi:cellobiose phosphorylase